ncbi:hypothetical protein SAMN05444358_11369 [Ruegeria halocynthiae]|uniref:Uncharacterized protein n=1 Tax=Ruegeria halocynthiae TaxID=985054 RepID=A0A1H3F8H4_9RHOB|nr:hypothetical protein SAMN05444358_11369 [Ruegeria halocynthiae]
MKKILALAGLFILPFGTANAQEPHVFRNPCERGSLPLVGTINHVKRQFVVHLLEARSELSLGTAELIGHQLCEDLLLVNDSEGLTRRSNSLLASYVKSHSK